MSATITTLSMILRRVEQGCGTVADAEALARLFAAKEAHIKELRMKIARLNGRIRAYRLESDEDYPDE